LDGFVGVEPRSVGIALADGLSELWGKIFSLKTSMTGGKRAVPLLNYALAFAFQSIKITDNLSHGS
jgi:hypothetical protein